MTTNDEAQKAATARNLTREVVATMQRWAGEEETTQCVGSLVLWIQVNE